MSAGHAAHANHAFRVITPAGPIGFEALGAGLELARSWGIDVVCDVADAEAVGLSEAPWLAGDDAARAGRWEAAVRSRPGGVWLARGGVGCMRVLAAAGERIAVAQGSHPVAIWAFSDGTALLADAWRRGWPAWMAPPVTQLARLDAASLARTATTMRDGIVADFEGLEVFACPAGQQGLVAEGPIFAGNLAVLASLCGTRWQPDLRGAILVLEDVGEVGFRVDRFAHQLFHAGFLDGLRGLVWGEVAGVHDAELPRIAAFLRAFSRSCPALAEVPVLGELPIGHGARNAPLPVGAATGFAGRILIGAGRATLGFGPCR